MADDLKSEHERLLERTVELEREHRRLQEHPEDVAGHMEHSARLREQIQALHEHIRRLRGEARSEAVTPGEAAMRELDREYSDMLRSIARAEHEELLRRARMVRTFASDLCVTSRNMRQRASAARVRLAP